MVHVLTGPDHLSALATLSANVDIASAFLLGVRWGIGHSTGLLLVGIVFILLTQTSNDETIEVPQGLSRFFESLVGVFMILLGVYGIWRALKHKASYTPADLEIVSSTVWEGDDAVNDAETSSAFQEHLHTNHSLEEGNIDEEPWNDDDEMDLDEPQSCLQRLASSISTRGMALIAGIIHGLAGPGGVLGVIPAVQLHDTRLAAVYLGCFCASSTLTMGLFAIAYGGCSSRLSRSTHHGYTIEVVSASLSLLVGVLWLFLLSIGKLEDVFS